MSRHFRSFIGFITKTHKLSDIISYDGDDDDAVSFVLSIHIS